MTTDILNTRKYFSETCAWTLLQPCGAKDHQTLVCKSLGHPKCHARKQSDLKLLSSMESYIMCHFLDNFTLSGPLTCVMCDQLSSIQTRTKSQKFKILIWSFICVDIHYFVFDASKSNLIPNIYDIKLGERNFCTVSC